MSISSQNNQVILDAGVWNRNTLLVGSGVFLGALILYVFTLAPTVIWGDSAAIAVQAYKLHLAAGADAHPLFVILGKLFLYLPFEAAYSLNLLSAIIASIAVAAVFFIIHEIIEDNFSAIIGAAALAFSHAFWLHAVITEVYDFNALFVLLIVLVLLKWAKSPERTNLLYLAAFLLGLGLSNHLVLALAALGFFYFIIITNHKILINVKVLLLLIFFFFVGNSLFSYLVIKKMITGTHATAIADSATGGFYKKAMMTISIDTFKDVFMYFSYLFYQFPFLSYLLGFVGMFTLLRKKWKAASLLVLVIAINMVFFVSFGPGTLRTTKYTFYISDYAVFSIFIGYGWLVLQSYLENRGHKKLVVFIVGIICVVLLPVILYNITPHVSKFLKIDLLHARTIQFRDNETFFLNPSKRGYRGAEEYGNAALLNASRNSVIIADYTPFAVLNYLQEIKQKRTDVKVVNSGFYWQNIPQKIVTEYYGKRDIYLADMERGYYRIGNLEKDYEFIPDGVLYKIKKKE